MIENEKVNILLVDDQPAKLLSYEVVLRELEENLIQTSSATEALEVLLKNEIAVVLVDVCMPDLDGFELAAMNRDHPRFQRTAIIFISAINISEADYLRGYQMGAVDYVPVPVVLNCCARKSGFRRAHRKTRQLEQLNRELEQRVNDRRRSSRRPLCACRTANINCASRRTLPRSDYETSIWSTAGLSARASRRCSVFRRTCPSAWKISMPICIPRTRADRCRV